MRLPLSSQSLTWPPSSSCARIHADKSTQLFHRLTVFRKHALDAHNVRIPPVLALPAGLTHTPTLYKCRRSFTTTSKRRARSL